MARAVAHSRALLLAALLGAVAAASATAAAPREKHSAATIVSLFSAESRPAGARLLFQHAPYQSFDRPLPTALEASLFEEYEFYFNETQEFEAKGPNKYIPSGRPFVAELQGGCVRGILGDVYDSQKRVLAELAAPGAPTIAWSEGRTRCKHYARLASPVQRYGHMYFHFMQEVLPRVILMRSLLKADPSIKLLMFGAPYEYEWLSALGIPKEQVELYDPSQCYCADSLIVPAASPSMMPPKENYIAVRSALLPEHSKVPVNVKKEVIVYCSRKGSDDRQVSNEQALLSAVARQYPNAEVHVYHGTEGALDTVHLFRRATIVMGMHGAGLSHLIFSDPGTAVIEFLFMSAPPLMFWHAASALHQRYIMVPLPQSWWLQPSVEVPVQDVLNALAIATRAPSNCPAGFGLSGEQCTACPAGTYSSPASGTCQPCAPGHVAPTPGAAYCRTCPVGTFPAASPTICVPCRSGSSTLFPGAPSAELCVSADQLSSQVDSLYPDDALAKKLVTLPAPPPSPVSSFLEWLHDATSVVGEWFDSLLSSDASNSSANPPAAAHGNSQLQTYLDQLLASEDGSIGSDSDDSESALADRKEADDEFALLRLMSHEEQSNPDALSGATPQLTKRQQKDMLEHQLAAEARQQAQGQGQDWQAQLAWRPQHAKQEGAVDGANAVGGQDEVPAWRRFLQSMESGYGRMLRGYRRSMAAVGAGAKKDARAAAKRQRKQSMPFTPSSTPGGRADGSDGPAFKLESQSQSQLDAAASKGRGPAKRRRSAVARAAAERVARRSRQLSGGAEAVQRNLQTQQAGSRGNGVVGGAVAPTRVSRSLASGYGAMIAGPHRRSLAEQGQQAAADGMQQRKQGGSKRRGPGQGKAQGQAQGQGQGGKGKGRRQGGQMRKGGAQQQRKRERKMRQEQGGQELGQA